MGVKTLTATLVMSFHNQFLAIDNNAQQSGKKTMTNEDYWKQAFYSLLYIGLENKL